MQATGSNNLSTTYRLSIHVFVDGFSVSVSDSVGRHVWHNSMPFPEGDSQMKASALRAMLLDGHVSSHTYDQVEMVSHAPSTYLPVELFRRSDVASVYRLTFSNIRISNSDIRHRILPGLDVVEVFSLNQMFVQMVTDLYPQTNVQGRAGQVICQSVENERRIGGAEPRMHVHVDGKELHVCVLAGSQLRFACTYQADTEADRVYYLMAVWRNLKLDVQRTACLLNEEGKSLMEELRNYILHVELCA
ncbi:MAG: DUF3822 family protein [Bacteroidaceae bacterium]